MAAYVELGYPQIEARIEVWSKLDRELIEIDENLIRRRLTVLDRGRLLLRRKAVYEELHPEARQHARGGHVKAAEGATETISPAPAFATDVATKLSMSERTVQEETRIAKELTPAAAELIEDTALADEKVKLMELTRLPRTSRSSWRGRSSRAREERESSRGSAQAPRPTHPARSPIAAWSPTAARRARSSPWGRRQR